ncbi:hypothetical protein [Cupriavidus necator]
MFDYIWVHGLDHDSDSLLTSVMNLHHETYMETGVPAHIVPSTIGVYNELLAHRAQHIRESEAYARNLENFLRRAKTKLSIPMRRGDEEEQQNRRRDEEHKKILAVEEQLRKEVEYGRSLHTSHIIHPSIMLESLDPANARVRIVGHGDYGDSRLSRNADGTGAFSFDELAATFKSRELPKALQNFDLTSCCAGNTRNKQGKKVTASAQLLADTLYAHGFKSAIVTATPGFTFPHYGSTGGQLTVGNAEEGGGAQYPRNTLLQRFEASLATKLLACVKPPLRPNERDPAGTSDPHRSAREAAPSPGHCTYTSSQRMPEPPGTSPLVRDHGLALTQAFQAPDIAPSFHGTPPVAGPAIAVDLPPSRRR